MKIIIFGALFLALAVAARNLESPLNDGINLQEIYDNATAWTWTKNIKTGGRVKRQDNCFTRWMNFANFGSSPGWDLQTTGNQNTGWEGWEMHSRSGAGEIYRYFLLFDALIYSFFVRMGKNEV